LAELIQLGYFQAFAGIALPNAGSIALHESLGFTALGIYRNVGWKLGAWHDVGWWQKELSQLGVPLEPKPFAS
jgi:L-amino acid N-acyltransferase YncA